MKRPTLTQLMLVCLLLVFSLQGIQAQSSNLLENPEFEDFDTDENVADGWQAWNTPVTEDSPDYERVPQYDAASNIDGRIQSGDEAQVIFTDFYYTFSAGVYQQVEAIEAGTELTFSTDVYIWSSMLDDPDVSEGQRDVFVYVGIDPTGGTDGTSEDIVWSIAVPDQYDEYVDYSVTTTAEAETVTTFVWIDVGYPASSTFAYIDDAVLEAAGTAVVVQPTEGAATPELTEAAEPTEEVVEDPIESPEVTESVEMTEETEDVGTIPPEMTDSVEMTEETEDVGIISPEATESVEMTEETEDIGIIPPEMTESVGVTEALEPSATPTLTQTATASATSTETERASPTPTEEVVGEVTPVPTDEDIGIIVEPTATDISTETEQPTSTEPPVPTTTPEPTATDVPTETEQPTSTEPPVPTTTPEPTATDVPTDEPESAIESVEITEDVGELPAVEAEQTETFGTGSAVTDDQFRGQIVHVVQPDDTVQRIAQLYGSSIDEIIEANDLNANGLIFVGDELIVPVPFEAGQLPEPSNTPVVIIVTATPTTEVGTGGAIDISDSEVYVVQPGDTLSLIADFFDTTVTDLAQRNGITNSNQIAVGQQILVPADVQPTPTEAAPETTRTHTVQSGENLYRIALRYGVTVGELQQANNLFNPNTIYAGQVLRIP